MSATEPGSLVRAAVRSLRGFVDLAKLQGVDADESAFMLAKATGAAIGLMIGRRKAALAFRMVATELMEADTVDQMLTEIQRDDNRSG